MSLPAIESSLKAIEKSIVKTKKYVCNNLPYSVECKYSYQCHRVAKSDMQNAVQVVVRMRKSNR